MPHKGRKVNHQQLSYQLSSRRFTSSNLCKGHSTRSLKRIADYTSPKTKMWCVTAFMVIVLASPGFGHPTTPNTNVSLTPTPQFNLNDTNSTMTNQTLNGTAYELIARANNGSGEGQEVHEFDMRFPITKTVGGDVFNAPIRDRADLWPGGVIPYVLDIGIRRRSWFVRLVLAAMDEWERKTCIKFRQKTSNDYDYVEFHAGEGCNSDVGMIGGRQTVSLGSGCEHHSVILHELGHVIGFWHEQNRPDRDKYIRIVRENIIPRFIFAFHKYSTHKINSLGVPYDYKSIMHYGKTAFSRNQRPTLVALDGRTTQFGNDHLSPLDILQANRLYKCPDKSKIYPTFPNDFRFSLRTLSGHYCVRLYEPHDRMWRNTHLCIKSGKKPVKFRWSSRGLIYGMTCTRISNPTKRYYKGWNNNYLCAPRGSPYNFKWSVGRIPSGYKCTEWRYDSDREWGRGKYLCSKDNNQPVDGGWGLWAGWSQCTKKCGTGYQKRKRDCTNPRPKNGGRRCNGDSYQTRDCNKHKCRDLPSWPGDFTYRYHRYTPYSSTCIRTYERRSYFQWTNYYFCSRGERQDINMKWSDHGPIRNMRCVLVNEPSESRGSGWNDNYLCVPKSSPYHFRWSYSGPIPGLACVQWVAKNGRHGWNNNYLCAPPYRSAVSEVRRPKVDGRWSSWSPWSRCSKTCGTGSLTRTRQCNNPAPMNGGRTCGGFTTERKNCKVQECVKECRQALVGSGGTFRSPQMGRGRSFCTWTITARVGQKIKLWFYFYYGGAGIDCTTDYVEIRDGRQATSPVLRRFCPRTNPPAVWSSGNGMWISFRTGNSAREPGFTASWRTETIPTPPPSGVCGGRFSGENGQITSPNFPRNYPRNKDCVWIITVPVHKVLKLRFQTFELENHSSCKYDYVEVRDGSSERSPELGTFCGRNLPKVITAFTNSLRIKFHSDSSNTRIGFKALYYTEPRSLGKTCGKKWRHFVADDGTEYCYLIRKRRVVWKQAREDCKRRKSDLLSIATSKEQWFVRNELMAETKYYELWMGYNDLRREGRWTWSDKTKVVYSNWAGGDPNNGGYWKNEDCGVLKPDGKWNDFPCNHRFMYICKRKLR